MQAGQRQYARGRSAAAAQFDPSRTVLEPQYPREFPAAELGVQRELDGGRDPADIGGNAQRRILPIRFSARFGDHN
jgi:hypothetical protein